MADVEARVELNCLLDFYAPLLTEHRREVMRLYCEEDLSLAEIAQQLQITRQGVSDALKKARQQLEDYEDKLGLAARYRALGLEARKCLKALEGMEASEKDAPKLAAAKQALQKLTDQIDY